MNYADLQKDVLEEFAAFPPRFGAEMHGASYVWTAAHQREYHRVWRAMHPAKNAAYEAKRRPQKRASEKAWKAANPEKVRAQGARYRARCRTKEGA